MGVGHISIAEVVAICQEGYGNGGNLVCSTTSYWNGTHGIYVAEVAMCVFGIMLANKGKPHHHIRSEASEDVSDGG